jgi:hypothetical protein
MAKQETAPRTQEKPLTKKERDEFVERITDHLRERSQELVLTTSWRHIGPYVELVGMTGILLGDESLEARQQVHLKKMMAVQYSMIPKRRTGLRAQEFLAVVEEQIPHEISVFNTLPDEPKKMPAAWRNAYSDTVTVQTELSSPLE